MNFKGSIAGSFIGRRIERLTDLINSSRQGIRDVAVSLVPLASKAVIGFLSSILLARGLRPAGMGEYALVLSVTDTVTSLSDLGIGQTAIRYASLSVSQNEPGGQLAVLRWAFRIRIVLTGLMVVILFLAAPILGSKIWHLKDLSEPMRIGLLLPVFGVVAVLPSLYFQSLKRFGMNSTVLTVQTLLSFMGIGVIALLGLWSVPSVVTATAVAAGVGAVVFVFLIPGEALWRSRSSLQRTGEVKNSFWRIPLSDLVKNKGLDGTSAERFTVYLLLSTVIVIITLKLDVWLMGYYLDQSQIGLYNIAARVALPLQLLLGAFTTVLWPRASSVTKAIEAKALLKKTFKASFVVAIFGVVYLLVVPMLIPVLFGNAYEKSVILARTIAIGYCIAILANPISVVGYSFGMARIYWIVNLLQMTVVIVMLILLLPRLGALGAALTFVANALVGSLVNGCLVLIKAKQLQ